jgi:hypothetical protein
VEESRQDLKCDLVKGTVSQILYCCYNFLLGNPGSHANDARQQKFSCLSLVQWASYIKRNLAALQGKSH